jgi:hypothetical protein
MADLEVLKSYLVSLGFKVDQPQLRKFEAGLKQAGGVVQSATTGIVADLIKWQIAAVSAFVGVSSAVLGMADSVAMADQKYRLMGLRMFMSTEAARKLSIGMRLLGASMEEIAWDPELRSRFIQLSEDQDRMAKGMGSNYEANMRSLRDLRFELVRFTAEMEYLSMSIVNSLFGKFGTTIGDVEEKLRGLNEWIQANMPAISDTIATYLLPILKATWTILEALGPAVENLGVLFMNLMGILSGDDSLMGTEITFQKMGDSIGVAVSAVGMFVHVMILLEQAIGHFATFAVDELGAVLYTVVALTKALWALAHFDLAGAKQALTEGMQKPKDLLASAGKQIALGGTDVAFALGGAAITENSSPETLDRLKTWDPDTKGFIDFTHQVDSKGNAGADSDASDRASRARAVALKAGAELNVDPRLIFEHLAFETANFTNRGARDLHNFAGINVPGGKGEDYRKFASDDEFEKYYASLISRHYKGVLGATNSEQFAQGLKHGDIAPWYTSAADSYAAGMERYGRQYDAGSQSGSGASSITTGDININIMQPGATPEQIQAAATKAVAAQVARDDRQTQRTLAQVPYSG